MFDPPVIAVVDSDEAMREALSDLLQVLGMSCHTFDKAEAFLAAHTPKVFDCLITDVRMRGISGLELLRRLRISGSAMPVIIVTSDIDPMIRSRALEGGAHAYLAKPIADDVLLRHLRSALDSADLGSGRTDEGKGPSRV